MLQLNEISKAYGKSEILKSVQAEFGDNGIIAVIGNNGAGKTTLFNILKRNITDFTGNIIYNDEPLTDNIIKNNIILSDERNSYYCDKLYKIINIHSDFNHNFDKSKCAKILQTFNINESAKYSRLSKGMKNKFNIAIALASNMPVTLLDEPCSGLDESSRYIFNRIIIDETVNSPRLYMISTHLIDELYPIATDFLIIKDDGRAICLTKDELENTYCKISGSLRTIENFISERPYYEMNIIGEYASVVMANDFDYNDKKYLSENGIVTEYIQAGDACRLICGLVDGDSVKTEVVHEKIN